MKSSSAFSNSCTLHHTGSVSLREGAGGGLMKSWARRFVGLRPELNFPHLAKGGQGGWTVIKAVWGSPAEPAAGMGSDQSCVGIPRRARRGWAVIKAVWGSPAEPCPGWAVIKAVWGCPAEPARGWAVSKAVRGCPAEPARGWAVIEIEVAGCSLPTPPAPPLQGGEKARSD